MSIDVELQAAATKYRNKQKIKDRFISIFIGILPLYGFFRLRGLSGRHFAHTKRFELTVYFQFQKY